MPDTRVLSSTALQAYITECFEYCEAEPLGAEDACDFLNERIDTRLDLPRDRAIRGCATIGLGILIHLSRGGGFQLTDPPENTNES